MAEILPPTRDQLPSLPLGPVSPLPPPDPVSPGTLTAEQIAERLGRERSLESQVDPLIQERASMPIPQTHFQPNFGGGLWHDLGQALLALGAATTPGQAIESRVYGPGITQYETRQKQLADQISDIQGQQKAAEEPLGTLGRTNLGFANLNEKTTHDRNTEATAKQNADTRAQVAANNQANQLVRQAQGWKNLDIRTQTNNIRQAFDTAVVSVMRERVAAGMSENDARISAQEDMKAALSQNQYAVQHPILSMLGVSPDLSAAPGAQQPKAIQPPKAAAPTNKPAKQQNKGGGQHIHFDAQGNIINK